MLLKSSVNGYFVVQVRRLQVPVPRTDVVSTPIFAFDLTRLLKGCLPVRGLGGFTLWRYNLLAPRPRVVYFHLSLRGLRAAFFV